MLNFWALNDGYLDIKQRALFGDSVEDVKFRIPFHCFLIETEDRLILIDTGYGSYCCPTAGNLAKSFEAIGKKLEDVSLILFTHLHPDHIGGLPLFPNTTICVSAAEADYWLNDGKEVSTYNQKHVKFVRKIIEEHKGKILLFRSGEMLLPCIETIEASGHTPGHTAFLLSSIKVRLLLWGDLVHSVDLQFGHPGQLVVIDDNPEEAAIHRMQLLDRAADGKLLIGGAHLPGSGLGYVNKIDKGFEFVNQTFEGSF